MMRTTNRFENARQRKFPTRLFFVVLVNTISLKKKEAELDSLRVLIVLRLCRRTANFANLLGIAKNLKTQPKKKVLVFKLTVCACCPSTSLTQLVYSAHILHWLAH